tara:strand:+ start:132 stop:1772 length:1641 start_codon:yes stop_codon:yes gene_type:complete
VQIKTKKKLHLFLFTLFLSACGGGGDTQNLENVVDIVRPVISSANSFTVSENQTSIGSAVASISDYSTLNYSLSGADADAISINSSTGAMSFNSAPDYETKNSYAVKLNVAAGSVSTSQDITISISNTQEPISWVEASPESVGMDSGKLSDAFDKIFADGYWTQAALVIKDNKLIYERYRGLKSSEAEALENSPTRDKTYTVQERWGLRDINSVVTSWSTAKSITSVLIAIAVEQGFISSIDQSASDFIVEWANDSRNQITIRNLLDMQSGLHKVCWVNDGLAPCTRNGNDADIMYVDNQLQPCINREMAITGVTYPWHDSGATIFELGNYEYNNCDTMVLGEILFRATGKNIETYADIYLFSKIGMDVEWWQDNSIDGNYLSFCCIDATIRDFAKFGQLMLNNGLLDGEQIIPLSYINKIKDIPNNTPENFYDFPNSSYGLQFWTLYQTQIPNVGNFPVANSIYNTEGYDGQFILIDYANNMLVLRNSIYQPSIYATGERKWILTDLATTSNFIASLPGYMGLQGSHPSPLNPAEFLYDVTQAIN